MARADVEPESLVVKDWGRLAYAAAFARQRELNQSVIDGNAPDTLVLVEHDPVITLSHRRGVRDHLLADETELRRLGITVEQTDRGGDITYHGPGQLVAYPVLKLNRYGLNLSRYMRVLEQVVIDTAAAFGVTAQRDPGATGVWVQPENGPLAKLAALGVRVRKNVTMHGLALNVTTNLDHFATIDPCGLGGRPVTSLSRLLDVTCPGTSEVKHELATQLRRHLRAEADRSPRTEAPPPEVPTQ